MNANYEKLRAHWLVVATAAKLGKTPLACIVLETPIVLFRTTGKIVAMLDRCPHRNAPLSAGRVIGESIQCPYHGWQFSATGECVRRPGCEQTDIRGCRVEIFDVCESEGLIWVKLTAGTSHTPDVANHPWESSAFQSFTWFDEVDATLLDALENLLDATHTAFVHSGLVRSDSRQQRIRAKVSVIADNIAQAEYLDEGKQSGWISKLFERDRLSSFGRYIPPCTAELEYRSKRGAEFVLRAHFTPTTTNQLRVATTFFIRRSRLPFVIKRLALWPFLRRVLNQDRRILQIQSENVKRFGSAKYLCWQGDLLYVPIKHWLQHGRFPDNYQERIITLEL